MLSAGCSARGLRAPTGAGSPRYGRRPPRHDVRRGAVGKAQHAMTWTNRVVWQEGMFLRAQHFQQQDRWLEALVRTRTAPLRPHPWGIVEMAIDRELLATGRFALSSAIGMFEDGTPFAIPGETDHPPPLDLPESTRNAVVYLAAPVRQAGAVAGPAQGAAGPYHRAAFGAS